MSFRNFPPSAPSQRSLFNNIETSTTASRPLKSWRTFPVWRKHSTTSSAFRTRWRRCPRRRSNRKTCKEYVLLIYAMSIIGVKMNEGKYFLDFGLRDAYIILGPDLDLKYKLYRYLISSKITSFSMFTNTLLMKDHHHLLSGTDCTCESAIAIVAELWPFVAQFCIWRSSYFLHHISSFVHMLSCCDEIEINSRAIFNWTVPVLHFHHAECLDQT